jgi:NAD-dependent dihydropyrimidine dehydrogenase PreA subunit
MPELSYSQLMIAGRMTGLIGLREMLEALAAEQVPADAPGLGVRLVAALRQHNYVPPRASSAYEEALVRAYARHLEDAASGTGARAWRDPRKEHAPWYPTIFEAKCDGCGECLPVCPNNVLGWNGDRTKMLVLEPYECAPGCQLCFRACARRAIVMPPREALHQPVSQQKASACDSCSESGCANCAQGRSA